VKLTVIAVVGILFLAITMSPLVAGELAGRVEMRLFVPRTLVALGQFFPSRTEITLPDMSRLGESGDLLEPGVKYVKLLIYRPGSQVFAAKYEPEALRKITTLSPNFVPARMLPITIKVVDKSGKPAPGVEVNLTFDTDNNHFFESNQGGPMYFADVARATTDDSGTISVYVPDLLDDPYFKPATAADAGYSHPCNFYVRLERGDIDTTQLSAVNVGFPAKSGYPTPIVFTVTIVGSVTGKVDRSFFTGNKIGTSDGLNPGEYKVGDDKGEVKAVLKKHGSETTYEAHIYSSGSYYAFATPGTYDLFVRIKTADKSTDLPTGISVRVKERETVQADVK